MWGEKSPYIFNTKVKAMATIKDVIEKLEDVMEKLGELEAKMNEAKSVQRICHHCGGDGLKGDESVSCPDCGGDGSVPFGRITKTEDE